MSKKKQPIISLKNIGKQYQLYDEISGQQKEHWAIKKIDLTIHKGQKIGIIGSNGAGKSTLLKIIAGITQPTVGERVVRGKVVSLMQLGAGFSMELTGRENIMINGMLVGMTWQEVKQKEDEIIAFADIGEYIAQPFFTYSDGMKFRIAFAVAMASECDIMIIDEVFMAGDFNFQEKTIDKMKQLKKEKPDLTTIVTSHIPNFIWSFSDVFYEVNKMKLHKLQKEKIWKKIAFLDNEWQNRMELNLHN